MLDHVEVVRLADEPGGPTTRYTTRTVLESEEQVLRPPERLAEDRRTPSATVFATQFSRARRLASIARRSAAGI